MAGDSVQIVQSRSKVVASADRMEDVELKDNGELEMFVFETGYAERIYVGLNCSLEVRSGGSVMDVTLASSGSYGSFLNVRSGGTASNVQIDGSAMVNGGLLSNCTISASGSLQAYGSSIIEDVQVLDGGYIFNSGASVFKNMSVADGGKLDLKGCRLENTVIQANAGLLDLDGCTLKDCTVLGDLVGRKGASLTLEGTLTLGGACTGWDTVNFSNAILTLKLAGRRATPAALFDSWTAETGPSSFTIVASSAQSSGAYRLIEKAAGFDKQMTLNLGDGAEWQAILAPGEHADTENTSYSLQLNSETLTLAISNRQFHRVTRGRSVLELQAWWKDQAPVCLYGRDMDAAVETRDFFEEDFTAATPQQVILETEPARVKAVLDGTADIFLAAPARKWDASFAAENTFTKEILSLEGMNRFEDVLIGNPEEDAVVMLTDEDDALFADDIFSAFAEAKENRLQKITAIHAGSGNDLVDLTCQTMAGEAMGCIVIGGAGDDILWGGEQAAVLIGGTGDDRISSQRDKAIFAFGDAWGNDTIQVAEDMDYRLWFAEGTTLDITYDDFGARLACGNSSVAVQGVFAGIEDKILIGNAENATFNGYSWTALSSWL